MSSLLLVGGGGHCLTVIDSLPHDYYKKIGIVDKPELTVQTLIDIPFVGCDDNLKSLRNRYDSAFISLGSVGNWRKREKLAKLLKKLNFTIAIIVHSKAFVSRNAILSPGILAASRCTVNACAAIGEMCILNTGCIVEHDCNIESYTHIAPGAIICGGVKIGKGTHIGAGSVIKEGITIGQNVLIGIGSVVTRDVPDNVVAYGNPCKIRKEVLQ